MSYILISAIQLTATFDNPAKQQTKSQKPQFSSINIISNWVLLRYKTYLRKRYLSSFKFFSIAHKAFKNKVTANFEEIRKLQTNISRLHVKVTSFLKLPWNSFFPWILLERKDRTCDYDTPKVKYNELYHSQWILFFLASECTHIHQTCTTNTETSSGRWSADAFPIGIDVKRFLIGLRVIANPLLFYILLRKYRKMADELPDDFDVIVLGTGMLYIKNVPMSKIRW